jgi:hypothetical protein
MIYEQAVYEHLNLKMKIERERFLLAYNLLESRLTFHEVLELVIKSRI